MSCSPPHDLGSRLSSRMGAMPRMGRGSHGSVATMLLCETRTFFAYTVSSSVYDLYEITGDAFEYLGPSIEDLVIHVEATDVSTSFRYNIGLQRRFLSGPWSDPVKLYGQDRVQSDPPYEPTPPFSTRAAFGVRSRLVVMANVVSGGSPGERADLSILAAVRFFD